MLIDTHCHLDFPDYDIDRDEVIQRCRDKGLGYIIDVGSDLVNSARAVELSTRSDLIYACVGCHPHDADSFNEEVYKKIKELAQSEKVVAIGEIGLDYYRNLSSVDNQKNAFRAFIRLAKEKGLPIVVHTRQAQEDTLAILREESVSRAMIHCFSGDEAFLKQCLDLGYLVSFTCNVTYKKSQGLRDIVKLTPMDRMCLETDAPYLSPEGFRGKRNEPWFVAMLAEEIARIKGVEFAKVADNTTANAVKFFNLK